MKYEIGHKFKCGGLFSKKFQCGCVYNGENNISYCKFHKMVRSWR